MRVYECFRRFVWLALALLLLASALPRAAHAVPLDKLPVGSAAVVDVAQTLKPEERAALDARLRAMRERGLMQAALVLVDSTDGEPIFDYGMKLAEKWKLGKAGKDDGLLILIAVKDRKYHTFTGLGLEGTLTDVSLARIQRDAFTSNFRKGDYAGGIGAALDEMEKRLTADPDTLKKLLAEDKEEIDGPLWLTLATAGFGLSLYNLIAWALCSVCRIPRWLMPLLVGLLTGALMWLLESPPLHIALWAIGAALYYLLCAKLLDAIDALPAPKGGSSSSSYRSSGYSSYRSSGSSSSRSSGSSYSGGGGRFGGGGAGGGW